MVFLRHGDASAWRIGPARRRRERHDRRVLYAAVRDLDLALGGHAVGAVHRVVERVVVVVREPWPLVLAVRGGGGRVGRRVRVDALVRVDDLERLPSHLLLDVAAREGAAVVGPWERRPLDDLLAILAPRVAVVHRVDVLVGLDDEARLLPVRVGHHEARRK